VVCDLNFTINGEGLLKVTGSHVNWKSGNISEIMLGRDVVTTGHSYITYVIAASVMTLSVLGGHSAIPIASILKCDISYL